MKPGDLVSIYYDRVRHYIIIEDADPLRRTGGEQRFRIKRCDDGEEIVVRYGDLKIISKA